MDIIYYWPAHLSELTDETNEKFDAFNVETKLYFHRHVPNSTNIQNRYKYGTYVGGACSIIFFFLMFCYVITLLVGNLHKVILPSPKICISNYFKIQPHFGWQMLFSSVEYLCFIMFLLLLHFYHGYTI